MSTKIILPAYDCWKYKIKPKDFNFYSNRVRFKDANLVTKYAPKREKEIVYKLACYFRREFNYDFVQFCPLEKDDDYEAYIFQKDYEAYGACCFRRRQYDNQKCWALQWIWFHPYFREKGNLKRHWPFFRERYGDFNVEGPLSKAMYYALQKLDEIEKEQECTK